MEAHKNSSPDLRIKKSWALIPILILINCTGVDGRGVYTDKNLDKLNIQVAKEMKLEVLSQPTVHVVSERLAGPYGFAMEYKGEICINPSIKTVKNFHMFHEIVHVYQYRYGLSPYCGNEIHAQQVTSKWCETNNCPVKHFEGCRVVKC